MWYLISFVVSTAAGSPLWADVGADAVVVRHRGFADFSQGSFEDGGTNTYVSRRGAVQLIPRWDLNADGHLDLLFNQDHNKIETVDAFIYRGSQDGYRSLFPPFWQQTMPAYKLVQAIENRRRHVTFLPTFGGGPVKLIDLNGDGFLEIAFPNTIHNYSVHMDAYVYWGGPDGHSWRRRTELPTLFALDMAVADFNRDGQLDLAFANYGNETGDRWGYKNHLESYIYWGDAEGYSVKRRSSVPTLSAVSCAAGDFNGDGWPDLAFANNNLRQKSIYIYLGGANGFDKKQRLEREGGDPGTVRAGDLNGDGLADLVVASRQTGASVYLGSADFRLSTADFKLPVQHAKDAVIADFNADGFADIAFASSAAGEGGDINLPAGTTWSEVYWGSANGFDVEHRLLLPTLSPQAVATCDLNQDGFGDLVFANSHDGNKHDVPSYVYWGSAQGFEPSHRDHLQGFGPVGVAAADLDDDAMPEIVLMNQNSGMVDTGVPSVVFWGNGAHHYSQANATLLPAEGPYGSKVADLNDDGYPDIVFSGDPPCIHWGSAEGFKQREVLDLGERILGVVIGDLNRDGRLDIVFSTFSGDPREPSACYLLWGSEDGYSPQRSDKVRLQADRSCCGLSAADLDKDGYVDLILPAGETASGNSEVLRGGPDGFALDRSMLLSTNGVGAAAIADLDENGWLDLIFPGMQQIETQNPHTKSLIYWGSADGYDDDRRTELEAYTAGEIAVADLNRDGHLDLVSSNYKGEETRSLPIFIFWGNADHQYSDQRRTELPAESSCGIQVLDLNGDQFPEIVVHNHIKDGDHTFGGYVYWGSDAGYSIEQRTSLPIVGPHYSLGISPGNIYDRGVGTRYTSAAMAVPEDTDTLTPAWTAETPINTAIRFYLRAASSPDALPDSEWLLVSKGQPLPIPAQSEFVQYSAELISPDGGSSPLLWEVVLSFGRHDPGQE